MIGNEEEESCVIKSTVEYEVADDASADVSIIPVKPFVDIAEVAKKLLNTSPDANGTPTTKVTIVFFLSESCSRVSFN